MPEKTEVVLGGTKRFECRVIGYPRPDIKWYKDGVDITSNVRFNFNHSREGIISMLIEKVSRQDEGCYRCRAQNSEGMASTAAYLFVRKDSFDLDVFDVNIEDEGIVVESDEVIVVEAKRSKFLDDTPSIHSMSFGAGSEKDLEYDRQYTSKQMEQRREEIEEEMETEEYEQKESEIRQGSQKGAVTLTEITAYSEDSEGSLSPVEDLADIKGMDGKLEKMAKMYEELTEESTTKGQKISVEMESHSSSSVRIEVSEFEMSVESEVSIEEKKSKKIEISSEESNSVSTEMTQSSVTKEESYSLEEETARKGTEVSEVQSQERSEESRRTESQFDVSMTMEETKVSTQTADDSGLGLSFSTDVEDRSFAGLDDSLVAKSSVDTTVSSSKTTSITVSAEIEEVSIAGEQPRIEKEQQEEILEKKVEETESLHGDVLPESATSHDTSGSDHLLLPRVGQAECKAEELDEQSMSSVGDLPSEHLSELRTAADEYYGDQDLVLPLVKQLPEYKTEELKDQQSEGSVEDLPLDETSQSQADERVESPAQAEGIVGNVTEIREGPAEEPADVQDIGESSAEIASMSLGPDSGIFEMSLKDTQSRVEEIEIVGSSVDSVAAGEDEEGAARGAGVERVAGFVNLEQEMGEETKELLQESDVTFVTKTEEEKAEAKKAQEIFMTDGVSEENLTSEVESFSISETTSASETDVSDLQRADQNLKEQKVAESSLEEGDRVERTEGLDDTGEKATADVSMEKDARSEMVKDSSLEAMIEQASLDDIVALAEMQVIEGEEISQVEEHSAGEIELQKSGTKEAVESHSGILSDLTTSDNNLSDISDASQAVGISESKQSQEMTESSQVVQQMPDELILQADANVNNPEQTQNGEGPQILVDAEVEISESERKLDDTLTLRTDVDVSEESYDSEAQEVKMSASIPKVTRVPEDVSVQTGETIRLVSEVQGNPAPDVKWFKSGDSIKQTERISLLTEDSVYTLEITEAVGDDAGTYTLTAHNSEGTIFSDVHVVVDVPQQDQATGGAPDDISVTAILMAPEFVIKPEDVTVQEFEQVKLICSVKGTPTPEVKWQNEGQALKADNRIRIFESDGCHYLEIPHASFTDGGEYECIATNSEGTVSVVIKLTVEGLTDIDESGLSTNEDLRLAVSMSERSDTDVSTDTTTRRYIKLVGMAAAFTIVAFGINKVVQNITK